MKEKHSSLAGFTLVELLIAASIFSIIILSLYSAFQTGVLSYKKIDSAIDTYQSARLILNRIELDLKNSFIYSEKDSLFKGTSQGITLITVTDAYENAQEVREVSRVKYELSNNTLKRVISKGIDALTKEPKEESHELSSEIKEILFQFCYETKNVNIVYDWQEIWPKDNDAEQLASLPLGVKIKLVLRQRNRQQKETGQVELNKTISIPLGGNTGKGK